MSVFSRKMKEMLQPAATGSVFSRNISKARGDDDEKAVELKGAFVPSTAEDIARFGRLAKKRDAGRKAAAEKETARYKIELDWIIPKALREKPINERKLLAVFTECVDERRKAYKQDKKKDPRWSPAIPAYEGWESAERADSNFVYAMHSFISGFSWNQLTRLINAAFGQALQTKDWSEAFHIFENIMDIVMKIELDLGAVRYILTDRKNFLKSWDIRIVERENTKRKLKMTNDDEDVKRKLRAARHTEDDEDEDDIDEDDADEDDDDEDEEPAPKKVAKRRVAITEDDDEDDSEDEDGSDDSDEEEDEPAPKKKKRKVVDEEAEPAPRKKSSKTRRAVVEDDSDEEDDEDVEDDNDAEDEDEKPTPKRKKTVAAKKKVTKKVVTPKSAAHPLKPAKLATDSVLKKTSAPYEPGNGVKGKVYGMIKRKGTAYTELLAAAKEEGINQAAAKKLVLLFIKKGVVKIAVDEPEG